MKSKIVKNKWLILLVFLLFPFISNAQIINGLFAKYSFNDGTSNDEVGSVNGTMNNIALTNDRFGNQNHAIDFNPTNSFLSFGDNFDRFSMKDSSFSFSFWFQSLASGNEIIICKYGNSACSPLENQREFFIRINPNHLIEFLYYGNLQGTIYRGVQGNTIVNDTCWHHVVINYDGSIDTNNGLDRVEIFVDNVKNITAFSTSTPGNLGDIQNSTAHLGMGKSLNSLGQECSHQFGGKLDDVRLYTTILSTQEVDHLYNEINPITGTNKGLISKFQITDEIICEGECTDFLDTSINCPITREWIFENASINTSTNSNPANVCYSAVGIHSVALITSNGFSKNTLTKTVTVLPRPIVNLGNDTTLCFGDPFLLNAFHNNITDYIWQDGSINPTFTANQAGTYFATVSNICGTATDTIQLEYLNLSLDLGNDTIAICENESYIFDVFHPTAINYLWNNGSIVPILEVSESGIYHVSITNICENLSDSVEIIVSNPILLLELGSNQNICEDDTIILDATLKNGIWYRWQDSTKSPLYVITAAGEYQVIVQNGCGEKTDYITITDEDCCNLFIPNAFTPNNDGENDIFRVYQPSKGCNTIATFSMKIFDRWGGNGLFF